ncbi:unnamed protein product [Ilex paraguariensis]|uniref:Aldehyde dehydrogenase domain-containing protein n=1 Tax=Ilex paraguariensis TaxID=185542 RepID=A0ABC8QY47_9AQUA
MSLQRFLKEHSRRLKWSSSHLDRLDWRRSFTPNIIDQNAKRKKYEGLNSLACLRRIKKYGVALELNYPYVGSPSTWSYIGGEFAHLKRWNFKWLGQVEQHFVSVPSIAKDDSKDDVAGCFEYNADLAETLDSKQNAPTSLSMKTFKCHILREPIGVVGLITPWNYPLLMVTWKVALALAAGCTAILKPSELEFVTCLEFVEVCMELGLPLGVLNILTGLGPEVGTHLASHPHVEKVEFTQNSATRSKIMTAAVQLKPVAHSLCGEYLIVVFKDLDLDKGEPCYRIFRQVCERVQKYLDFGPIKRKVAGLAP